MVIAIDGPAGSGKTTIAKLLARKLNILYLDTGAIYRAFTLGALEKGVDLGDEAALVSLAADLDIKLDNERRSLDGVDVTGEIRSPVIDKNIPKPVSYARVRESMVKLQRQIVDDNDAVVEGRDITTVVFPQAKYKFYLDADGKERAKRRYDELNRRGVAISLDEVQHQMQERDQADFNRKVSPLKKAEDALCVNTDGLGIEQVLDVILREIQR